MIFKIIQGHRIPVLPKPLSQMKTTETRSYLSRLIWATNGWKRPQYGNPETKPVWWPNDLLNWAEMKKMGGKKADGLSNVNYNEIQKTILNEVCIVYMYQFYQSDLKKKLSLRHQTGPVQFSVHPEPYRKVKSPFLKIIIYNTIKLAQCCLMKLVQVIFFFRTRLVYNVSNCKQLYIIVYINVIYHNYLSGLQVFWIRSGNTLPYQIRNQI